MNRRLCGRRPRGAALLLALLVLTLVSTVAAGMAWHQHRAIEVEAAERARAQAAWMIDGGFEWLRNGIIGTLDTARADFPLVLAETDAGTLIAADRDNSAERTLQVFVSGRVDDAQSRYNLHNLLGSDGKANPVEAAAFQRLCESIGLGADVAARITAGLLAAWAGDAEAALAPTRAGELSRLGIDADTLARLERFAVVLPVRTPINAATAPREVLAAVFDGLDLASAERIVRARPRTMEDLVKLLPPGTEIDPNRVGIGTRFFAVHGSLRFEQRVLHERMLVERRGNQVVVLQRERGFAVQPG